MASGTRSIFGVGAVLIWAVGLGCAANSASREPARAEGVVHEGPPQAEPLSRFVLVLREGTDGQVSSEWTPADRFDLSAYSRASSAPRGDVVFATMRPRDCHAELLDCHAKCMKRPLPRGYGHLTEKGRGKGAKEEHCEGECRQPYLDCEEAQGRQFHEFSRADAAMGWLSEHRRSLLVGSVVVIAGVVFVTVSAGAGLFVLVPALLLSDVGLALTPHALAVCP